MKTLLSLFLVLFSFVGLSQESIKRNYFTTNQNPQINFTNGTLVSTNIYVSNIFATNITVNNITNNFDITTNLTVVNEFRGRTSITTNLYVTNGFITFLTNNTFYTTNVTANYVTNNLSYITNLYGPFITNNQLYSTNIYTTNLFATYVTNNTDYITNLYGPFITNNTIYSTNTYTTNLFATYVTNNTSYITNLYGPFITNNTLYSTNIYTTNLTANYITNNTLITTNLYVSNVFATNITVDVLTNNLFVTSNAYVTNLYVSNIFATNITLMEAIWDTNKWNGPTNDVSFKATYQKYVTSTDMEMTGLIDSSASNANTSVVLIDPGGATRTLYFPAVFTNYTSDGNNAYTIPSTNIALVTLFQYGNQNTNVVVRLFGPGTGTPAPVAQVWTNDITTDGTFDLIRAVNNRTNYPGFVTNGLVFTGSGFWENEYWDNVNPGFSALSQAGFMGDDPNGNLGINLESVNNANFNADNQAAINTSTNTVSLSLVLSDGRNARQNFSIREGEIYDGRKVGNYSWDSVDQWWWSTNGLITANGFTDNSGTPGALVAYQGGNRLGPTNISAITGLGYWASNHNIIYPGSSSNPNGTTNYVWIGGTNNQVTFPVAMFAVTNYVTNTQSASEVILNGVAGTNLTSDSYISGFDVYQFDLGTSMGNSANVFFSTHVGNHGGTTSVIGGGPSAYGLDSYMNVDNGSTLLSGSANSVQGFLTGDQSFSLGVSGIAAGLRNNSTNVGTSGEGILNTGGKAVGLFGEVVKVANFQTPPVVDSGALVLDTFDTGLPLVIARTNNGTQVASLNASGAWTAHGFTDDAFAANGVVTNDSTGLLHTTPTLPSTLLPTDLAYVDKNNAFTTASSNYVAMTVTTSTNQNQVTPDFSIPEQLMSTNAAFTFLAPVGVDTTKTTVQWTLVNVTNTTAAAVLITSPANCHTVGTPYVTNLTAVWFQCYGSKFTNAYYIPVF